MTNDEFEKWVEVLANELHITKDQLREKYNNDTAKIMEQINKFIEQLNNRNYTKNTIYRGVFGKDYF